MSDDRKYTPGELARMRLEAFAAGAGTRLETTFRDDPNFRDTDSRFYACFRDAEVKDGPCLVGTYGNGATPEQACLEYEREIAGKPLVLFAHSDGRRETSYPAHFPSPRR